MAVLFALGGHLPRRIIVSHRGATTHGETDRATATQATGERPYPDRTRIRGAGSVAPCFYVPIAAPVRQVEVSLAD